jgi:hypothetical protein
MQQDPHSFLKLQINITKYIFFRMKLGYSKNGDEYVSDTDTPWILVKETKI